MARQLRSTSAIIGRLATVIGAVLLVHVLARLLHMWGWMAVRVDEYYNDGSGWKYRQTPASFWDMNPDTFYAGWGGIIVVHVAATAIILLAILLVIGGISFFKWILLLPEPELGCQDKDCKCVEHDGKVFRHDEDGGYWDYPDDNSSTLAIAVGAAAVAAGVSAGVAAGS